MKRTILAALLALAAPGNAAAESFLDLWMTPDQQGRYFFERAEYDKAARAFGRPIWKGLAFYRAKDYGAAAQVFSQIKTPEGFFYQGNSYARAERLAEAVAAYKQALALRPGFPEATFNLNWVDGLLKLQQKKYEDAGGTGGKLAADRIVISDRAKEAKGTITGSQLKAQGLSDQQLREMWMRRVQTTPGDFLRLKFGYQLQRRQQDRTKPRAAATP